MKNYLDNFTPAYSDEFLYAFDNNIMLNWYPQRIMKLQSEHNSILELGVGHGYTTNRFSQFFSRHLVIDGSSSVINQFQQQYPNCKTEIVQSYFEDFDTEERFDVIVLGFVLEHVDDPVLLLRQFKKFLKPNGSCFITVPNCEALHRRLGHEAGLLNDMEQLSQSDLELGHKRQYSKAILEAELKQAGYKTVRKEGIFLKSFTTAQLKSLALDEAIIQAMCTVAIDYPELSCALLFESKIEP
jgi:2-polyprenyl-3-methyl-5-hydroxy-6-metoxy-1,4-benzoquinol methylase